MAVTIIPFPGTEQSRLVHDGHTTKTSEKQSCRARPLTKRRSRFGKPLLLLSIFLTLAETRFGLKW